MATRRSGRRIGILGHVGNKNLGDEAIIASVIRQIRDRYPDAEISAFTSHPEDTRERHAIPSFPIRRGDPQSGSAGTSRPSKLSRLVARIRATGKAAPWLYGLLKLVRRSARLCWGAFAEVRFLAQCHNRLKDIDLLIFAGSNQLNDYCGGPWIFPYDLLKWCILAKWVGAKVAFLCCGAGPLDSWLGKLFIKCSLSLADYRSYRDEGSRRLIESIGVAGDNPVCTDLALGLELPHAAQPESATSRLIVGINPLPFCDAHHWPEHNEQIYQGYVRKLAAFARWLHERGHSVVFFPTQLRADPSVIQDIRRLLKGSGAADLENPLVDRPIRSLEDLIVSISAMDIVVATRYHGVVLSVALHRPVLAIAYYGKTGDLMAQVGQSDYVVDITSFDPNALAERFVAMESRTQTIRRELAQRTPLLRQALAREYDRVFRLLEEGSRVGAVDEQMAALARPNG